MVYFFEVSYLINNINTCLYYIGVKANCVQYAETLAEKYAQSKLKKGQTLVSLRYVRCELEERQ